MKKKIKYLLPAVLAAVFIAAFGAGMAYRCQDETFSNEDFIRFHVIANSDSGEDQELKLKIRDGLLDYINEELEREVVRRSDGKEETAALDIGAARKYIREHIGQIETEAERIAREEGYRYEISAELGVRFIPEKTYGSLKFPAGNYEALTVRIGSGKGKNWWCVLYPPLCLIDSDRTQKRAQEVLYDSIMQGRYAGLAEAAHGKKTTVLKLKFKTLEWLGF